MNVSDISEATITHDFNYSSCVHKKELSTKFSSFGVVTKFIELPIGL